MLFCQRCARLACEAPSSSHSCPASRVLTAARKPLLLPTPSFRTASGWLFSQCALCCGRTSPSSRASFSSSPSSSSLDCACRLATAGRQLFSASLLPCSLSRARLSWSISSSILLMRSRSPRGLKVRTCSDSLWQCRLQASRSMACRSASRLAATAIPSISFSISSRLRSSQCRFSSSSVKSFRRFSYIFSASCGTFASGWQAFSSRPTTSKPQRTLPLCLPAILSTAPRNFPRWTVCSCSRNAARDSLLSIERILALLQTRNPSRRNITYSGSLILTKRESTMARKCSRARQAEKSVIRRLQAAFVNESPLLVKCASSSGSSFAKISRTFWRQALLATGNSLKRKESGRVNRRQRISKQRKGSLPKRQTKGKISVGTKSASAKTGWQCASRDNTSFIASASCLLQRGYFASRRAAHSCLPRCSRALNCCGLTGSFSRYLQAMGRCLSGRKWCFLTKSCSFSRLKAVVSGSQLIPLIFSTCWLTCWQLLPETRS